MKTKLKFIAICHLLCAICFSAFAQGTVFTYQGRLNSNGSPASGNYDFRFRLSSDALGNNYVGSTLLTNGVIVGNGLFTVALDFGANFPGADRWLEIGVRTNGGGAYTTLSPLQALTPTPYAIFAAGASNVFGVITSGGLSGNYSSAVSFNNASNTFNGSFNGNGSNVTNVNAITLGGLSANQFWKTIGNSNTVAGVNFLGTTDYQPVEVRVNNARALRVEPGGTNGPNVIWGHSANSVIPGVVGAVIGGGGGSSVTTGAAFTNRVTDAHGVVGGGLGNIAGDDDADPASARYATVGGGIQNQAASRATTIAGGEGNFIQTSTVDSTISGGRLNNIAGSQNGSGFSTISGGDQNAIQTNSAYSTIGGGTLNTIQTNGNNSVIGGGWNNIIKSPSGYATIAGGAFNVAIGSGTTVGGGYGNTSIASSNYYYATVAGGNGNTANGYTATVGGGGGNSAILDDTTIAGGGYNTSSNFAATVGGGFANKSTGDSATIAGGGFNNSSGDHATIGGGEQNTSSGSFATVSGGIVNYGPGHAATVPGGQGNNAAGDYSFAAGLGALANHQGTFVWSDSSDFFSSFSSTTSNQFNVRANGGVRFVTGGAGMTLDGPFQGSGSGLTSLNAANISSGTLADARLSANVPLLNAGLNTFAGDISMSGGAAYHHIQLSGGNSLGYLYGAYNPLGDGIHLGYNFYYDASGGSHVINAGGGTSRITAGYGEILLYVGGVNTAPATVRLDATTTGVTVYGTFNNLSDRNAKQDFKPVSPSQILNEVAQLSVSEWSYKEDAATRHIGPVAQDFYSTFNIGTDDKHIAPIDEGGVALAAIQGLNQKLTDELKRRDAENVELKQRLDALEKIIRNQKSN